MGLKLAEEISEHANWVHRVRQLHKVWFFAATKLASKGILVLILMMRRRSFGRQMVLIRVIRGRRRSRNLRSIGSVNWEIVGCLSMVL